MSESTHVDAAIVPLALPLILPRVKNKHDVIPIPTYGAFSPVGMLFAC